MFPREIRDLSTVRRWGTLRTIQQQNVAEHSLYVAIYADKLSSKVRSEWRNLFSSAILLRYCMWHDMPETFSGDPPGPWKRSVVDEKKWTDIERQIMAERFTGFPWEKPDDQVLIELVKIANVVDEVMFLSVEISLGNRIARAIRDGDVMVRLKDYIDRFDLFYDNNAVYAEIVADADHHAEENSRFLKG